MSAGEDWVYILVTKHGEVTRGNDQPPKTIETLRGQGGVMVDTGTVMVFTMPNNFVWEYGILFHPSLIEGGT